MRGTTPHRSCRDLIWSPYKRLLLIVSTHPVEVDFLRNGTSPPSRHLCGCISRFRTRRRVHVLQRRWLWRVWHADRCQRSASCGRKPYAVDVGESERRSALSEVCSSQLQRKDVSCLSNLKSTIASDPNFRLDCVARLILYGPYVSQGRTLDFTRAS